MLAYYGSRISDHMTETPEGFLICHDVPINRTGSQQYLRREVGLDGDGLVTVVRDEDEVFSPAAMASFEGKPVTQDHPPCAVEPYNYGMYTKGHAQNVHRGTGSDSDLNVADLFINDPELIRAIKGGMREVSCGYECEYVPGDDGRLHQRKIRGNHVAVVAAGRAGPRVSIKDSAPESKEKERIETMQKEKLKKKPSMISRFFMGWAADKDPDEAASALDELLEEPEEEKDAEPAAPGVPAAKASPAPSAQAAPVEQAPAVKKEAGDSPELVALLKQVLAKLESQPAPDADPIQNLVDELSAKPASQVAPAATPEDQESSVTVPAEKMKTGDEESEPLSAAEKPKNPIPGADSAIALLNAIKPHLAKLPEKERRAAADAATQAVRKAMGMKPKSTSDGYAAIQQAMKQGAAKRNGASDAFADEQIGKNIMAKYNPHYQKK